jgi:hypothetical protein
LGDRHERHALGIEDLDDLGEIGERARQPVDLVDDHDIDLVLADLGEQPLSINSEVPIGRRIKGSEMLIGGFLRSRPVAV